MPETNSIPEEYISARKFAKLVGVNVTSVTAAMDRGELAKAIVIHPANGHRKLLQDIALEEWANNRSTAVQAEAARANGKNNRGRTKKDIAPVVTEELEKEKSGRQSLQDTRIQKAQLDIAQQAIKLKKMKGDLVEKSEVYKGLFLYGRQIRDAIMGVPDRVIDQVFNCDDRNEAHTILSDALREALEQLSASEIENINFETE